MVKLLTFLAATAVAATLAAPADARPKHREQDVAFEATQQGRIMPLREIEGRIIPQMRGAEYLGPELDGGSSRYRLKFLKRNQIIWIDVDARTGRVLAKSGN